MIKHMTRYPFQNIENFRDLGGMPAEQGYMTRWGVFYRSADLHGVTQEEANFIYNEMNIRTIIDLRAPVEIDMPNGKDPFMTDNRFTWIHLSLIGDISFDEELGVDMHIPNTTTMSNFYKLILKRCPNEFAKLMQYLKEGVERGAVLFHCSAGKDRTGMTAMFLESLCGVKDKDIISQYEVSRTLLKGYRLEDQSGSHFENMEVLLAYIEKEYGTPTQYLLQMGVPKQTLDVLRKAFLEPVSV